MDDRSRQADLPAVAGGTGEVSDLRRRLFAAEDRLHAQALRIAQVEHVVKSALAVIGGWAKTLDDRWDSIAEETRREGIAVMRRRADALISQTTRMLVATRAELAPTDLHPARVDLSAFLADLIAAGEIASDRHDLRVEVTAGTEAWADPVALTHVLSLLVENAVKYSPDGGVVALGASPCDGAVHVTVRDEGVGMPAGGPDLFAPFERGAQRGGDIEGTGLGLHIVRTLVEAMGGAVAAHANHDRKGSTFVLTLPAA